MATSNVSDAPASAFPATPPPELSSSTLGSTTVIETVAVPPTPKVIPVGTDGVSQLEEWGAVKATGDQGRVADHIYPLQPIIAIIYVCAPVAAQVEYFYIR